MKHKKIIIIVSLVVVIILGCVLVYNLYHEGREIQSWVIDIDKLEKIEKEFQINANINDCAYILDSYAFLKRYRDSIRVGTKCVELGIDNYDLGWLIHIRLAISYSKLMKDDKAQIHIQEALQLDKKGIIKSRNWFETMEAEGLIIDENLKHRK